MIHITENPDGTKTAKHVLVDESVTYHPDQEKETLQTLESKAVGEKRNLCGVLKRASLTDIQAVVAKRGADGTALNLLSSFVATPKVDPVAHKLDNLIDDLEFSSRQKMPTDQRERLAMFAREIRQRDQKPAPEGPSKKALAAIEKMEQLREHLLHTDTEDVNRLIRVELTLRQLREGDPDKGYDMVKSVVEAEKQIAAERSVRVAERQDELRREAAALEQYSDGLAPLPEESEETADAI